MDFTSARIERRELKQKLFQIRRYMEGENISLNPELKRLKALYESLDGFTDWLDFPEKWDVGDPNCVKKESVAFNDVDKANIEKKFNKSYETIIRLDIE